MYRKLILIICLFNSSFPLNAEIILPLANQVNKLEIKDWKSIRDEKVFRQSLTKSCGAASLANLLQNYYQKSISEKEILKSIDKEDDLLSMEDLQKSLLTFGFTGNGYSVSYTQLETLKIPVIVFVRTLIGGHFAVLRGVNSKTVWLSDPAAGNRTLSKSQFLDIWGYPPKEENGEITGRIFAVLPAGQNVNINQIYFTKNPIRQTKNVNKSIFSTN